MILGWLYVTAALLTALLNVTGVWHAPAYWTIGLVTLGTVHVKASQARAVVTAGERSEKR